MARECWRVHWPSRAMGQPGSQGSNRMSPARTGCARFMGPLKSRPPRPLVYRLMFMVPRELGRVAPGYHQPVEGGPVLEIDLGGLVHVSATSRGEVFNHAALFLRRLAKGKPACTLVATCIWPPGSFARGAHEDHWSFAVGADVSWVPSPLGAEIAAAE